jgi:hypothetical protein
MVRQGIVRQIPDVLRNIGSEVVNGAMFDPELYTSNSNYDNWL